MKAVTVAAAVLFATFAASGASFAKDGAVPQTHQAAKASPLVKNTKRPARTPVLDSMSTGSIAATGNNIPDTRPKAPADQSGIAVNPWIVQNIF